MKIRREKEKKERKGKMKVKKNKKEKRYLTICLRVCGRSSNVAIAQRALIMIAPEVDTS